MSYVDGTELRILNKEFGAVDYTPDANLFAGLFTVVPADDGTGGTEATGGSYARVSVANDATQFPSANPKVNANVITYLAATADWGTIKGMGWFSASTAGSLRAWSYLCDMLIPMAVGLNTGDLVWAPGHAFTNGMKVIVWAPAGSTLPTGLSAGTEYFVIGASGNNFQLSLTSGGSAVVITVDGSMTIARSRFTPVNLGDTPSFKAGDFSLVQD